MFNWGIKTIRQTVYQTIQSQSDFYLSVLENEVERIKILQFDLLNDDSLNKIAYQANTMSNYDYINNINLLRQRLLAVHNSSSYIKNIQVHFKDIERSLASVGGLSSLNKDHYHFIRAPINETGARIISYDGEFYLSTVLSNNYQQQSPPFLVEIQLDKDAFKRALNQFDFIRHAQSKMTLESANAEIIAEFQNDVDDSSDKTNPSQNDHYFQITSYSAYLKIQLINSIPSNELDKPINSLHTLLILFSIAAVVILIAISLYANRFIHQPLMKLVTSFREVETGNFEVRLTRRQEDEFGYIYTQFNAMVSNIYQLIERVYHQELLMQQAKFKQLQSQIHPHFLYNSFFTINMMARLGDENLVEFSRLLGEYYQFITKDALDIVTLEQEISHARTYMNLQAIRFSNRLEVVFPPCPEEYKHLMVPRLIIQPILENAIKYGTERLRSSGRIEVSYLFDQHAFSLITQDNGDALSDEDITTLQEKLKSKTEESEVSGLMNIHRRIQIMFGNASGLSISRSSLGGLMVEMKIKPIENQEERT